jgi:hypothetical protein
MTKKMYDKHFAKMNTTEWIEHCVTLEKTLAANHSVYVYPSPARIANMLIKSKYMKTIARHTLRTYVIDPKDDTSCNESVINSFQLPYDPRLNEEENFCAVCGQGGTLIECETCHDWYHYEDGLRDGNVDGDRDRDRNTSACLDPSSSQHARDALASTETDAAFTCQFW